MPASKLHFLHVLTQVLTPLHHIQACQQICGMEAKASHNDNDDEEDEQQDEPTQSEPKGKPKGSDHEGDDSPNKPKVLASRLNSWLRTG